MIRVAIVDDQSLIRTAVAALLGSEPDIVVVGEAADGVGALELIAGTAPDVALLDIRMPHMDGIQATRAIRSDPRMAATSVLILTTFEEDAYVLAALRAGASGFIGKGAEREEIVRAVRAANDGEALLSPTATRALIERFLKVDTEPVVADARRRRVDLLTSRETEVLTLVARGRSNQELADELFISPATAKTHVNRILSKLGLRDRVQLVIFAYETGLVQAGP
jgi:DNA-binding NarL/FixJ family response regulator